MLTRFSRIWLVLAVLITARPSLAASDVTLPCPVAQVPPLALPQVKAALASNSELTIVALGSSSTQGWRSSSIAHSYPAILQAELSAALPQAHVAVINRGIGGQDAAEMLPRLESDVLPVRPVLVIWQVGANGAIKQRDPEQFRSLVAAGVHRLQDAKVDVVLMDNQRAPAILSAPQHTQIAQATADVAVQSGTGLFGRGALMDRWRQAGHPYEQFISADGVHHNDFGYRCVAKALAAAILEGLGLPPRPNRSVSAQR